MAFKKTLVQRLFNLSRFSTPSNMSRKPPLPDPARTAMGPDPGEAGRMKRIVQRRPLYQSAMHSPSPAAAGIRLFPPFGENLSEKLRGMDIARDRIRLEGLMPFPAPAENKAAREEHAAQEGLTASEVRKVLRAAQVEMIRQKLREIPRDWISYTEFVEICKESCGGNLEQGLGFAKTLDESGSVIVLGNAVFLRHHQVGPPFSFSLIFHLN